MPTSFSPNNIRKIAPHWWRKLENALLGIAFPAITLMIQGWPREDTQAAQIAALKWNLFVGTGLVSAVKFIGMLMADSNEGSDIAIKRAKPADETDTPS